MPNLQEKLNALSKSFHEKDNKFKEECSFRVRLATAVYSQQRDELVRIPNERVEAIHKEAKANEF